MCIGVSNEPNSNNRLGFARASLLDLTAWVQDSAESEQGYDSASFDDACVRMLVTACRYRSIRVPFVLTGMHALDVACALIGETVPTPIVCEARVRGWTGARAYPETES